MDKATNLSWTEEQTNLIVDEYERLRADIVKVGVEYASVFGLDMEEKYAEKADFYGDKCVLIWSRLDSASAPSETMTYPRYLLYMSQPERGLEIVKLKARQDRAEKQKFNGLKLFPQLKKSTHSLF